MIDWKFPHRVLVVDDDADVRAAVARSLRSISEIDTARTLAEARARLRERSYALVVLDPTLPDGSGLALLDELGERPARPDVVVLTRHGNPELSADAKLRGAIGYLEKSGTPGLLDALRLFALEAIARRSDTEDAKRAAALAMATRRGLAGRPAQALELVAMGIDTQAELASEMEISKSTVGKHVAVVDHALHPRPPRSRRRGGEDPGRDGERGLAAIKETVLEQALAHLAARRERT